jgi:hypothetical protein
VYPAKFVDLIDIEGAGMPTNGKRRAQEILRAVAKSAAEEARFIAGEVADAAGAAAATAKAVAGGALDKVATAIEARAAKGAKATGSDANPVAVPNEPAKKGAKTLVAKRRTPPKRKKKKKKKPKTSREASKKKRT